MIGDVTIVTHRGLPGGAPDDQCLAAAIEMLGGRARYAVWDDPAVDWSAAPVTIVRSTWDYHFAPSRWREWLAQAAAATRLVNPVELLGWNSDKAYLLDLERDGVAIVPTIVLTSDADVAVLDARLADRGWADIVVKPTIGASAHGARRFTGDELPQAKAHATGLVRAGAALVQPFQPGVLSERERSLVMIAGRFSHAFTKPAFDSGATSGPVDNPAHSPSPAEHALAEQAIAVLPQLPAYARVDLVPTPSGPTLMELELIEPHLALTDCPAATQALASLLVANP